MAHNGDPVMDTKGKVIGVVTSCAIDKEGFLTGLAYVEKLCAGRDTAFPFTRVLPSIASKAQQS